MKLIRVSAAPLVVELLCLVVHVGSAAADGLVCSRYWADGGAPKCESEFEAPEISVPAVVPGVMLLRLPARASKEPRL